jgi:hypothetical protein
MHVCYSPSMYACVCTCIVAFNTILLQRDHHQQMKRTCIYMYTYSSTLDLHCVCVHGKMQRTALYCKWIKMHQVQIHIPMYRYIHQYAQCRSSAICKQPYAHTHSIKFCKLHHCIHTCKTFAVACSFWHTNCMQLYNAKLQFVHIHAFDLNQYSNIVKRKGSLVWLFSHIDTRSICHDVYIKLCHHST